MEKDVEMNLLSFSFNNLKRRKLRTTLVIVGIMIGVMLVTSLLVIMDGLERQITQSMGLLSGNVIVQRKGVIDQVMSIIDASLVEEIEATGYPKAVSPEIYLIRQLRDGGIFNFVNFIGITEAYAEIVSPDYIKTGEPFGSDERGASILGMKLARKLDLDVGDVFQVDSHDFRVSGIFETKTIADTAVALIPIEDAREISGLPEDKLSIIEVRPMRPEDSDEIEAFIEGNYEDLEVVYPREIAEEGEQVMGTIRNITWIVSSIAVIVGGIGIANAMTMSVLERTSEIGLLKATGWKDSDVGYSFILEALEIGVVGGVLGVVLGIVASIAATWVIPELPIHLAYLTLAESFGFALLLSVLSGVYPAIKAARLSPIVAIRGE